MEIHLSARTQALLQTVLVLVLTFVSPRHAFSPHGPEGRQTLSFEVCNGFTNQRLAIFYGTILAKETGRSLVLPDLLRHGMPTDWAKPGHHYTTGSVPFSNFYSERMFVDGLARAGIQVAEKSFHEDGSLDDGVLELRDDQIIDLLSSNATVGTARHVHVGCPFLRLSSTVVAKHKALAQGVFQSLLPADEYRFLIDSAIGRLGGYNMLHLRIENDWMIHCNTWEDRYGNCLASDVLREIGQHIADKGLSTKVPLYIATDWPEAHAPLLATVRRSLETMGYDVRSKLESVFDALEDREIRALKDYYLALGSQKFLGNSVSTFSAVVMLERQFVGKWSSYYNMGNVPLESYLPFYEFPWIFTYHGRPGESRIVKRAIKAAAQHGGVLPFCDFKGKSTDKLYDWLIDRGVVVLRRSISWDEGTSFDMGNRRMAIPDRAQTEINALRIPFAHELQQYNYALYTDTAVIFQSHIEISLFPAPLPEVLFMTRNDDIKRPCATDAVLMNLPSMRRMYSTLERAALSSFTDPKYSNRKQDAKFKENVAFSWISKSPEATKICSLSNAFFKKKWI